MYVNIEQQAHDQNDPSEDHNPYHLHSHKKRIVWKHTIDYCFRPLERNFN